MGLVIALATVIWAGGVALGKSRSWRLGAIAGLLLSVIAFNLVLPDDNALRVATGSQIAPWVFVLFIGLVANIYASLISRLKSRATPPNGLKAGPTTQNSPFSDSELTRYARQIVLRDIGGAGQKALKDASVLVIGAGGLGAPALQYLAAAGVGTIGVIDDDTVDLSNLQRQIIHTAADIGKPKVQSAAQAMTALNPHITIKPYQRRLTPDIAADLIADFDLVLDGSDNFDTRYLVNATCAAARKPVISAALSQWEGQISLFDGHHETPCYQCVFPERPNPKLVPSCAEGGVLGPLPGVLGAMMAVETVKAITGAGQGLRGRLLIYDALYAETRIITVNRRPDCPICGCDRAKEA